MNHFFSPRSTIMTSHESPGFLRRIGTALGREDDERKFLHELKAEAAQVCPEFQVLYEESLTQPPEQRTCG
jgi:hypothetical protein